MTEYERVTTALRNAHAAGDTEAARRLAGIARSLSAGQQPTETMPEPSRLPESTGQSYGDPTIIPMETQLFGMDYNMPNAQTVPANPQDLDVGTWLNRAGESMTGGLIGDEAAAWADSLIGRGDYDERLKFYRENEENLGTMGQLTADLAGAVPLVALGGGIVGGAKSLWGAVGRGIGLGAGAGATQGFMEGEGTGDRLAGALVGGGLGAGLGGAIPIVGAIGRNITSAVKSSMRDSSIGNAISSAIGVNPRTGVVLSNMMSGLDPNDMNASLTRAGSQAMLADASPSLGLNLGAAMRTQNPGSNVAIERVNQRAAGARDNLVDTLATGPRQSMGQTLNAINAGNAPTIGPLYRQAYNTPIDYFAPEGQEILDILSRMPQGTVNRAIETANNRIRWEGGPRQIVASIGDDGVARFIEEPSVQQLDQLKRALIDMGADSVDPITQRMTSEGALSNTMGMTLRDAIGNAVPVYRDALSEASGNFAEQNAARFGHSLLSRDTTTMDAISAINAASPAERAAMQVGVGNEFRERLGNVYAVASDPNVDARQAAAAVRELTSDNAQAKLAALFGDEWPAMKAQIDEAISAVGLRANTARRSDTAPNMFFDRDVAAANTPNAVAQGRPMQAVRELWGDITGGSQQAINRASDITKAELADVLTNATPQDTMSAVARALVMNPADPNAGALTEQIVNQLGIAGLLALQRQIPQTGER